MNETITHLLSYVAETISLIGVAVLCYGVIIGVVIMLAVELRGHRGEDVTTARLSLRQRLGYYVMLGLEFLIASDIIHSVIKPSLEELAHLGVIVVIRTVITISLNWELRHESRHAIESDTAPGGTDLED